MKRALQQLRSAAASTCRMAAAFFSPFTRLLQLPGRLSLGLNVFLLVLCVLLTLALLVVVFRVWEQPWLAAALRQLGEIKAALAGFIHQHPLRAVLVLGGALGLAGFLLGRRLHAQKILAASAAPAADARATDTSVPGDQLDASGTDTIAPPGMDPAEPAAPASRRTFAETLAATPPLPEPDATRAGKYLARLPLILVACGFIALLVVALYFAGHISGAISSFAAAFIVLACIALLLRQLWGWLTGLTRGDFFKEFRRQGLDACIREAPAALQPGLRQHAAPLLKWAEAILSGTSQMRLLRQLLNGAIIVGGALIAYVTLQKLTEQTETMRRQTEAMTIQTELAGKSNATSETATRATIIDQQFQQESANATRAYEQVRDILLRCTDANNPSDWQSQIFALRQVPHVLRMTVTRAVEMEQRGENGEVRVERRVFFPNQQPVKDVLRQYMSMDRLSRALREVKAAKKENAPPAPTVVVIPAAPETPRTLASAATGHGGSYYPSDPDLPAALEILTPVSTALIFALHATGPGGPPPPGLFPLLGDTATSGARPPCLWNAEHWTEDEPAANIPDYSLRSISETGLSEEHNQDVIAWLKEVPEWTKHGMPLSLIHIVPAEFYQLQASGALSDKNKTTNFSVVFAPAADLRQAHLEGADLSEAHLVGADLREAHLSGASLREAHLSGANLSEAHLVEANLSVARLEGATLAIAHLEGASLWGAHLEGASLWGAHLEGAYLSRAHLEGADLVYAHLEGGDLSTAHLEGADFTLAHLKGVDLGGTYLEGADLRKADLAGVRQMHFSARTIRRVSGQEDVGFERIGQDISGDPSLVVSTSACRFMPQATATSPFPALYLRLAGKAALAAWRKRPPTPDAATDLVRMRLEAALPRFEALNDEALARIPWYAGPEETASQALAWLQSIFGKEQVTLETRRLQLEDADFASGAVPSLFLSEAVRKTDEEFKGILSIEQLLQLPEEQLPPETRQQLLDSADPQRKRPKPELIDPWNHAEWVEWNETDGGLMGALKRELVKISEAGSAPAAEAAPGSGK